MKTRTMSMLTLIVTLFFALLLSACIAPPPTESPSATEPAEPPTVTFVATDYVFDGPESVPAGWVQIRLENQGQELHHAQLLRLPADKSMDDLFQAMATDPENPPQWLANTGGPGVIIPGDGTAATVNLEAGNYVVICLIADADGTPHAALGMASPLTVTEAEATVAAVPEADITMEMFDYNFTLSEPITAGEHTFKVVNNGPQPHEVQIVQLAPGADAEAFLASMAPGAEGPPKGRPLGGLQTIDTGMEGYFTANFEDGSDYLLICFFPDTEDGVPHFAHGMMQVISVGG